MVCGRFGNFSDMTSHYISLESVLQIQLFGAGGAPQGMETEMWNLRAWIIVRLALDLRYSVTCKSNSSFLVVHLRVSKANMGLMGVDQSLDLH